MITINSVEMKKITQVMVLLTLCVGICAQEVAQWRGPSRTGIYSETGLMRKWPAAGPKMLWHFDNLGEGFGSAAVTSSGIYITGLTGDNGFVYAIDHLGKLIWRKEYGREWNGGQAGTRATPLVIDDKLYLISAYGKLVCMSTTDGKIIWSIDFMKQYDARNIEWGIVENLVYDVNVIYCVPGGRDANIVALDRNTGRIIWKSKGTGETSGYASPLLIKLPNRNLLVTHMQKSITGIDVSNGSVLWKFEHVNQYSIHPNVPAYINGFLYCTIGYGVGGIMLKLSADGSSVSPVWKNSDMDPKIGGFVVLNSRIYGTGDYNRGFYCLDWMSGKVLYKTSQLAPANIIANDGLLYLYSERGQVALVEPQTSGFNIISQFAVPLGQGPHWAHLVLHNKRLYVRHGSSLMVYDVAEN
jgi:outer membrane protein assembly factor BamB